MLPRPRVQLPARPSRAKLRAGSAANRFTPRPFGSLRPPESQPFPPYPSKSGGGYTIVRCCLRLWVSWFPFMGKQDRGRKSKEEKRERGRITDGSLSP